MGIFKLQMLCIPVLHCLRKSPNLFNSSRAATLDCVISSSFKICLSCASTWMSFNLVLRVAASIIVLPDFFELLNFQRTFYRFLSSASYPDIVYDSVCNLFLQGVMFGFVALHSNTGYMVLEQTNYNTPQPILIFLNYLHVLRILSKGFGPLFSQIESPMMPCDKFRWNRPSSSGEYKHVKSLWLRTTATNDDEKTETFWSKSLILFINKQLSTLQ